MNVFLYASVGETARLQVVHVCMRACRCKYIQNRGVVLYAYMDANVDASVRVFTRMCIV